jgi:hypothetical protein
MPNVRTYTASAVSPLAPIQGYPGCLALVPDAGVSGQLDIALYVDQTMGQADAGGNLLAGTGPGVAWQPPLGTVVIDLAVGDPIGDAASILAWLTAAAPGGDKPGTVGGIGGGTGGATPPT